MPGGAGRGRRAGLVRVHGLSKDRGRRRLIAMTGLTPDLIIETT
jgi:hypothetical protein